MAVVLVGQFDQRLEEVQQRDDKAGPSGPSRRSSGTQRQAASRARVRAVEQLGQRRRPRRRIGEPASGDSGFQQALPASRLAIGEPAEEQNRRADSSEVC